MLEVNLYHTSEQFSYQYSKTTVLINLTAVQIFSKTLLLVFREYILSAYLFHILAKKPAYKSGKNLRNILFLITTNTTTCYSAD